MLVVLDIIFIVACIISAFKESKITGKYKALGIYGRVKAYLAFSLGIGGICSIVVPLVTGNQMEKGAIPMGIFFAAIGILIYVLTFLKTPPEYKKTVIPCMIITALGVTMKLVLFYLPFVWKLAAYDVPTSGGIPDLIQGDDGTLYNTRTVGNLVYIQQPDGKEVAVPLNQVTINGNQISYKDQKFHY